MSNACPNRDESLLLFAHGQLGFWASLGVKWHARSCPHCRERLARYSSLSGLLATAMAAPAGPRWLPPATLKVAALRGTIFLLVAGLLTFGIWSMNSTAAATNSPAPNLKTAPGHCGTTAAVAVPALLAKSDCGKPKVQGAASK